MSTIKSEYFMLSGDFFPKGYSQGDELFCSKLKDIFFKSKFNVVNLESPVTGNTLPSVKAGPNLKLDNSIGDLLESNKIDAVTMANNHICDYGLEGVKDTVKFLKERNIQYCGVLLNGKKENISHFIGGSNIAFFNYCESEFCTIDDANGALEIDPCDNYLEIVKCESDIKVVILHAGTEHSHMPNKWLRKICRYYIDIGADLVVCHHTHVVSGKEIYKDKDIFYGLGNFVFPKKNSKKSWNQGLSLKVHVEDGKLETVLIPHEQSNNSTRVSQLEGSAKEEFLQNVKNISMLISDKNGYDQYWEQYYQSERVNYLSTAFNHSRIERGIFRKLNLRIKKYNEKKQILRTLNFIKCQSHRFVYIEVIKRFLNSK